MNRVHKITLAAILAVAITFIFNACGDDNKGDDGGGWNNNGSSKRSCIEAELKISANTLDDVVTACNAIRSDVLSQLPSGIGYCNKNDLSFSKPIRDIMAECGVDEIPIVNPSSSSNGNNQGTPDNYDTYTLTLVSYNSNSFTYMYTDGGYSCTNGGTLKGETHDRTINYSLNYSASNNILVWENQWSGDTLHFNGTSNNLIGTWTRTKDKSTSCWTGTYEIICKEGWGITKLVFTQNTVTITGGFLGGDNCPTDEMTDGKINNKGWKCKIISCDTYEMSKGTEKITMKLDKHNGEITYNGKTCSTKGLSQRIKACSDAWNKIQTQGGSGYLEDYYYNFLEKDFEECLVNNNFPEEDFDYSAPGSGGAPSSSSTDTEKNSCSESSGTCSTELYPYCYGYGTYKDCNLVGGKWILDKEYCFSGSGTMVNANYCNNRGIAIDNTPQ
jgi:hypothetical protein